MKKILEACAYFLGLGLVGYVILLMLSDTSESSVLPVADSSKDAETSVSVDLTPHHPRCSSDSPLLITVRNRGKATVSRIGFDIRARRKGHSSWLTTDGWRPGYSSDKFVKPGEEYEMCVHEPWMGSFERPSPFETEYFIELSAVELGNP